MALPAAKSLQTAAIPEGWMSISEAALRIGVNAGNLRRTYSEKWAAAGLARQIEGQWFISPAADPRLRSAESIKGRDLQQLAELSAQRIAPKYIDVARKRVTTINGLAEFALRYANLPRREQRRLYLAHLKSTGADVPSVTQFYEWERFYNADGLKGLVPAVAFRDTAAAPSVGASALERIQIILNAGNNISIANAIRLAALDAERHPGDPAWKIPSYRSVCLALAGRPKILRTLTGKGERAARGSCIPKMPRDFEAIAAGDEYCGDERTLDVWCRVLTSRGWKAIRPKLTCWQDMRSRVIVGWLLAPHADSRTILGSLKRAVAAYGKPLRLRTDWGEDYRKAARHGEYKNFDGQKIGGILDDLNITVHKVAPYTPWAKPIESFFRTMKSRLDQLFAGFWGGCPLERHEDRSKYIKANLEKLPTLADIEAALAAFFDFYHHTEHSADDMFGKTPVEAMDAFRDGPILRESAEVLNHLFKSYVGPKLVRRDGICHNGSWYGHGDPRLVAMPPNTRVLLAIQPEEVGVVTVCDLNRRPLFDVECLALEGLSERQVRDMHAARRRLMRPFAAQAKDARTWMLNQNPAELLTAQAKAAKAKRPGPQAAPPSLTIVRPDLEEAIDAQGKTPTETAALRAASKAVRTGTYDDDDDAMTEDLLGPSAFFAPPPTGEVDEEFDE